MSLSILLTLTLIFIEIIKELSATLILRPFNFNTLAIQVYEYASEEKIIESSIPSLIIVVLCVIGILFMSKINPSKKCNRLNNNEIKKLIFNIKKVLQFSISKGGTTIRDFQNTLGESGNYQQFFYVYGRNNKKCSRISCKGKIKKIVISNRSSFFCEKCQN